MGLTYVDLEVANTSAPSRTIKVRALVDSGATDSVVPGEILQNLGITPIADRRFDLANGEVITRRRGVAVFRFGDHVGGANVIFGEPGDFNLMGVHTLEALGL